MPYKDPQKKKENDALRAERMRELRRNNPELKEKEKKRRAEWYQKNYHGNPEYKKYRNKKTVAYRYKMTLEDYDALLEKQNYACAICRAPHYDEPRKRLSVDHDHPVGMFAVRGLLCQHCNSGLGMFKDNVDILKAAIEYLEKQS